MLLAMMLIKTSPISITHAPCHPAIRSADNHPTIPNSRATDCFGSLVGIEAILLLHLLDQRDILRLRLFGSDTIIDNLLPSSLLRLALEIKGSWCLGLLDRRVLERLLVVCVEFL
jgi:hypothetical protein